MTDTQELALTLVTASETEKWWRCDQCGAEFQAINPTAADHSCAEMLTLTFIVTVTAKKSVLCKHLGSRLSRELHEGGPIYLNDLVPEFDYESGAIEKVERALL